MMMGMMVALAGCGTAAPVGPKTAADIHPAECTVQGGCPLQVTGSGFNTSASAPACRILWSEWGYYFEGVAMTNATVVSSSLLHCLAPPSPVGGRVLFEVTMDGQHWSAGGSLSLPPSSSLSLFLPPPPPPPLLSLAARPPRARLCLFACLRQMEVHWPVQEPVVAEYVYLHSVCICKVRSLPVPRRGGRGAACGVRRDIATVTTSFGARVLPATSSWVNQLQRNV